MSLHPEIAELVAVLRAMEDLLRRYDMRGWADRLARSRGCLENADAYGLAALLRWNGGMGSLNDVVLQRDGYMPQSDNNAFNMLRERAWEMADRLKRDLPGQRPA